MPSWRDAPLADKEPSAPVAVKPKWQSAPVHGQPAAKAEPITEPVEKPLRREAVITGKGFTQPSKFQSFVSGLFDQLTVGSGDEIMAGVESALTDKTYDDALQFNRKANEQEAAENPGSHLTGSLVGAVLPAAATVGAAIPATVAGKMAVGAGVGALQGGAYAAASDEGDIYSRLKASPEGATIGALIGIVPGVGALVWKGSKIVIARVSSGAVRTFAPTTAAEKKIVQDAVAGRISHAKAAATEAEHGMPEPQKRFMDEADVDAARASGQRPRVADLGSDQLDDTLRAASNISQDAADTLKTGAVARQSGQGDRVTKVVREGFGDETLNPEEITTALEEQAKRINKSNYTYAETSPNAKHMWDDGGPLQRAISSEFGQRAVAKAIQESKEEALSKGEEVFEPIFRPNDKGLMEFVGIKTPGKDGTIQGMGMNLKFWDHVKRKMDDEISSIYRAGKPDEARSLKSLRDRMVASLDQRVPAYKTARGDAKEAFDLIGRNGKGGALHAGADYFNRMKSFKIADARAALQDMSPPERELFARGYAGELVTKISTMGGLEDVNKLFKSPQSRMQMRDALGDHQTDLLEAFMHREMAQSTLHKALGANSTTVKQALAAEGLKTGAAGGVGYLAGGDYQSALIGASLRGGYKFGQMAIAKRYAKALADLAMSEDPETIQRILSKVSRDPEYMRFSRAVADGLNGAVPNAAAASRREPRLFRDGGPVRIPRRRGSGKAGLIVGALEFLGEAGAKAMKSSPDDVLKKLGSGADDPPFFVDKYDLPAGSRPEYLGAAPDRSNVTFARYTPKAGTSKRMKNAYTAMIDRANPVRRQMLKDNGLLSAAPVAPMIGGLDHVMKDDAY